VISEPSDVKELFMMNRDLIARAGALGQMLGPGSTFSLEGLEHRQRRKLLVPPFHGKRMQGYEAIVEEEVIRDAHVSAPTRARRFLSRFFVVVIVALAIEGLVATFKAIHEDMAQLPYAGALLASSALLLIAWGAFIWFNRAAEELEPEAMQQAKEEDRKLNE